jgi:hypothetical protein
VIRKTSHEKRAAEQAVLREGKRGLLFSSRQHEQHNAFYCARKALRDKKYYSCFMPAQTFIVTPLRHTQPGTPARVRSCLDTLAAQLRAETAGVASPSNAERLALWTAISEWSAQNLAALEGTGNTARGAMAHGGEGHSG